MLFIVFGICQSFHSNGTPHKSYTNEWCGKITDNNPYTGLHTAWGSIFYTNVCHFCLWFHFFFFFFSLLHYFPYLLFFLNTSFPPPFFFFLSFSTELVDSPDDGFGLSLSIQKTMVCLCFVLFAVISSWSQEK